MKWETLRHDINGMPIIEIECNVLRNGNNWEVNGNYDNFYVKNCFSFVLEKHFRQEFNCRNGKH